MIQKTMAAVVTGLAGTLIYAADAPKDTYHMFPKPSKGYVRYIVEVPKTDKDNDRRIEVLIGKKMMVDCNYHTFWGKIEKFPVKGWGYHYYKISDIRNGPTTMRACPGPKKEAFISLALPSEEKLIPYNSRLGRVFYVPKGFEVRYRIWKAEETVHKAQKR